MAWFDPRTRGRPRPILESRGSVVPGWVGTLSAGPTRGRAGSQLFHVGPSCVRFRFLYAGRSWERGSWLGLSEAEVNVRWSFRVLFSV